MSDISDPNWHLHMIHEGLQRHKEDKWGWVIYRTTYKDDAGWERFKSYVKKWSDEEFSRPGVPAGLSPADWTFVSDPALEGASREQLRQRFREWRRTAWHTENPRRQLPFPTRMWELGSRYLLFIQVDEESLESVLDGAGDDMEPAWVHLVRCDDERDVGVQPPFQHSRTDQWVVDDGWMMIGVSNISGWFYDTIGNIDAHWDVYYVVPPDVLWY
jgi:hypothetical protein